jgi:predicted metal-binding protein
MSVPEHVAASPQINLFICKTCRIDRTDPIQPRAGATLAAATAIEAARTENNHQNVSVSPVACLGNCTGGLSAVVTAADRWTYVFGELTVTSAADLLAASQLLAHAEDGRLPLRGRPDGLKGRMIARIPPLPSSQDTPS